MGLQLSKGLTFDLKVIRSDVNQKINLSFNN